MTNRLRSTSLFGLLVFAAACHAQPTTEPTSTTHFAQQGTPQGNNADLEARYRLAIAAFDQGAYDDAADQFAQMLLRVPQDPSGDELRHLLIQHVAWSLLGSYDMSGDSSKLDRGESMLERYLAKHEQLRPAAEGERVEIYALLGEYTQRRENRPPTEVNALLQDLVRETYANLQQPTPSKHRSNEDLMVREVDVHTVRWGSLDDPRVQAYFRDSRFIGASLFEQVNPMNEARVLVRGWADSQLAYDTLREVRPALEACYEQALSRGADTLEKLELELSWDARSVSDIDTTYQTIEDGQFSRCVNDALRGAAEADGDADQHAELHLTFFVQPPRYLHQDKRNDADQITKGAMPEDASITRCTPGTMQCQ